MDKLSEKILKYLSDTISDPDQCYIYFCDYVPNVKTVAMELNESEHSVRTALVELENAGLAETNKVYFRLKTDYDTYCRTAAADKRKRRLDKFWLPLLFALLGGGCLIEFINRILG